MVWYPRGTPEERFLAKVEKTETCWLWTGAIHKNGYGRFGALKWAHRWAYEHFVGPIPDQHDLDHLCSTRNCVNPTHLEPVLRAVNTARARDRRTACRRGHLRETFARLIVKGGRYGTVWDCGECRRVARAA